MASKKKQTRTRKTTAVAKKKATPKKPKATPKKPKATPRPAAAKPVAKLPVPVPEPVKPAPVSAAPAGAPFVGIASHPLKPATQIEGLGAVEKGQLDAILERYDRKDASLLAILQDIQTINNYLPRQWMEAVCKELVVPRTRIYRLATFFKSLSLDPRGKHICQVCVGTTCHVRGAPRLVDKFELALGIGPGQTTEDMQFTLETVGCVGACALGPVVVVDKQYHRDMTADKLGKVIARMRRSGDGQGNADEDSDEE